METLFHAGVSNAVSATVLAICVACLSRPLARRPAVLHCLWLLVLLKLVTPPLYEVPIPWPASSGPVEVEDAATSVAATVVDAPDHIELPADGLVIEWDPATDLRAEARSVKTTGGRSATDWVPPLAVIWLGGTATVLIVSFRRIRRFQRLLRGARPASESEQGWVDAIATRLGLRRGPVFEWVHAKLSPMIWAVGRRPRLIVPGDLWKTLDERQRSTLIVHELAHLRRGDHRVRYFELLVTALFWWHPLVWWVRHALRDAEEQCCDAWVVWAFPDAARSYAETLLETLDFLHQSEKAEPLLASGFGKVHHLRRRLTMILSGTTPRLMGVWGTLGLLGLAAMLLPVNPTWAQKPEKPKEIEVVVKCVDDLTNTVDAVAIETDDADAKSEVRVIVKSDESPELHVSGSLDQALAQLKEKIAEISETSPRTEKDEKRLKALVQALAELGKLSVPIERGNLRIAKLKHAGDWNIAPQAITAGQRAEIDKARSRVKELTRELESKHKELAEAQATLAKLTGARLSAPLFLHRVEKKVGAGDADAGVARREDGDSRVIVEKRIVARTREKPPTEGVVRKVDPTKPRVEMHIGSDDGLVRDELKLLRSEVGKVKVAPEQQRIEKLEKKLKALLDEVESLKKEQTRGAFRR